MTHEIIDITKENATEAELHEIAKRSNGPVFVNQTKVSVAQKIENKLERIVDGMKDESISEAMETLAPTIHSLDAWSKIVARLKDRNVKVETTVTAMGILAMFPVAIEETK